MRSSGLTKEKVLSYFRPAFIPSICPRGIGIRIVLVPSTLWSLSPKRPMKRVLTCKIQDKQLTGVGARASNRN
jgi:hypothetical protein